MPTDHAAHTVFAPDEGLRLQSGPGRDLIFKVTGEDTGGAFDYFIVEVAPKGGPAAACPPQAGGDDPRSEGPLQDPDRRGPSIEEGGFAYLPQRCPTPSST